MPPRTSVSTAEDRWRRVLTQGHRRLALAHRVFRHLPGPPRCKVCHNPFGGIGGKLVAAFGFRRSRKNPNLCTRCCDALPPGGAEVDIAVLFADVRGSTALAERMTPAAYAALLNRFYSTATGVLIRNDAIIDKFTGDGVMALFIPGICGPQYKRWAGCAAVDLLRAVGFRGSEAPWLPMAAAVSSGVAYVGNVGADGVVDFTALGDPVNAASRLLGLCAAGDVMFGETVYESLADVYPGLELRHVELRGKDEPYAARVLRV